jgi:hypothetical protein
VVVVVVGDQCCTVLILRIMKQKGIGNMVCKKTQFYYDSQKEVQPTISLDGERERKKQSKQKKQSLLAAMLLVSAERERESVQTTVRQSFICFPGTKEMCFGESGNLLVP